MAGDARGGGSENAAEATPLPTARIDFLEWVRGTAAAMVVIYHLLARYPAFEEFSRTYLDLGRVGVVAFFLVSGYIISASLGQTGVRTFLIRRVFRLFPLYLFVLGAFLVIQYSDENWSSLSWWAVVAINFTMLHMLVGVPSLLGPSWTLSIEWIYYTQQAVAKRLDRLNAVWMLGFVWVGLFVAGSVGERVLGRELPLTFFLLLAVACLGHAWYLWDARRISARRFAALMVTLLVGVPLGAVLGLDDELWTSLNYSLSFVAGIAWFALAFLLRNRLRLSPLVWLGSISYALYLLATPIRVVVFRDLMPWAPEPIAAACYLAAVVLVSWLAHRFIELPFNRLGRRVSGGKRPAAVSGFGGES